jgi:polysaccharide biosynthesis protein VpsJ
MPLELEESSLSERLSLAAEIEAALRRLDEWLVAHEYRGNEPFDGLSSFVRPLTFGTKLGRQILVQTVKRIPFNLRPYIGIKPTTATKAMGFFARGYFRWSQYTGSDSLRDRGFGCLDWLKQNQSAGFSGPCWGNSFDYQTRLYYLQKFQPTVVWSSLIGHAFVDSFEKFGREHDLVIARGICDFILRDLPRFTDEHGVCISYVSHVNIQVHNANALAAAILARVYKLTRETELLQVATDALAYTVGHQNSDGSWYYGQEGNLRWIDNWHTAYVLDSLLDFTESTQDRRFRESMIRGWNFYFQNYFLPDGCPKYYFNKTYPIDIQCASQSIETLCRFCDAYPQALKLATRVALWTIQHMQDSTGYFYTQKLPRAMNRTPCLHWGQASMLSALAGLLLLLKVDAKESSNE